jgi:hypothetical protein
MSPPGPLLITFAHETLPDARGFERPCNDALLRILARESDAPGGPCVIGNCQAGWAIRGLAAPLSHRAGALGLNPMRCSGGWPGGSWLSHQASDLGKGRFDGAKLLLNFAALNPCNRWWSKDANLCDRADSEGPCFLEFERWWRGGWRWSREASRPCGRRSGRRWRRPCWPQSRRWRS